MAKDAGINTEEIETIQSIVMAVSGCRVRAQFHDARGRGRRGDGGAPESP